MKKISPSYPERRTVLAEAEKLIIRAYQYLEEVKARRLRAANAAEAMISAAVQANLSQVGLDQLEGNLSGKRIRWAAFLAAPFHNAAEIALHTQEGLERFPGIGEESARAVMSMVRAMERESRTKVGIRFERGDKSEAHTKLLRSLLEMEQVVQADTFFNPSCETALELLNEVMARAKPAGGRIKMFFRSRAKRDQAMAGIAELTERATGQGTLPLANALWKSEELFREALPENEDEIWDTFEKRSADLYAVLDLVAKLPRTDLAAAKGGLCDEMVAKVESLDLVTTGLRVTMRGYQAFGAKYAVVQKKTILGDEMGLGKTIEALAFYAHLRANGKSRALIVCPASVVANWKNEIAKWSDFGSITLHGSQKIERYREWMSSDVMGITTFDTLSALPLEREFLPDVLIVDEAHFAKNSKTRRYQSIRFLSLETGYVLFLTGTPMENKLEEFQTLAQMLDPEMEFEMGWLENFMFPPAYYFRRTVAPLYLRRNQEDVLHELPERIECHDYIDQHPAEQELYENAIRSNHVFAQLRRQASLSPETEPSAKLERLLEIVSEAAENGLKVVVFSNFIDSMERVVRGVRANFDHVPLFGPIRGSVPPAKRQAIVAAFSASPGSAVLVAQIKAGGVGLNIQSASVVIILEPQWTPSSEEQAIARCHRMGQLKTVQVHRLIALKTVEIHVCRKLARKEADFNLHARPSEMKEASLEAIETMEPGTLRRMLDDSTRLTQREIVELEHSRLRGE